VCNGKETLETSWLLRSFVVSCIDKWKSTCIGRFLCDFDISQ
jgi:sulfate adenylyltransferase subunit 1 (EFTu-like GTPase family)